MPVRLEENIASLEAGLVGRRVDEDGDDCRIFSLVPDLDPDADVAPRVGVELPLVLRWVEVVGEGVVKALDQALDRALRELGVIEPGVVVVGLQHPQGPVQRLLVKLALGRLRVPESGHVRRVDLVEVDSSQEADRRPDQQPRGELPDAPAGG